jgi:hypothetical protein
MLCSSNILDEVKIVWAIRSTGDGQTLLSQDILDITTFGVWCVLGNWE